MKWGLYPASVSQAKYIVVNGDESRTGHLQRPRADGRRSAPVDRRHPHRGPGGRLAPRLDLHSRRVSLPDRHRWTRRSPRLIPRAGSARTSAGHGLRFRSLHAFRAAGAYECGENRRAARIARRQARQSPRIQTHHFRPFPAHFSAPRCSTTSKHFSPCLPSFAWADEAWFSDLGIPKAGGTKLTCLTGHVNKPGVYELKARTSRFDKMLEDIGGGIRGRVAR